LAPKEELRNTLCGQCVSHYFHESKLKERKMRHLVPLIGVVVLVSSICLAQDVKESATKMEQFVSKTGIMFKFIDTKLPDLKLPYQGVAEVRIRKIICGGETRYFLQISKKGEYGTKTASIAYEDLVEIIKALKTLRQEISSDVKLNPDYLENKFITEDGLELGYYVNKKPGLIKLIVRWYLVLERYGSENMVLLHVSTFEQMLNNAKDKIVEAHADGYIKFLR